MPTGAATGPRRGSAGPSGAAATIQRWPANQPGPIMQPPVEVVTLVPAVVGDLEPAVRVDHREEHPVERNGGGVHRGSLAYPDVASSGHARYCDRRRHGHRRHGGSGPARRRGNPRRARRRDRRPRRIRDPNGRCHRSRGHAGIRRPAHALRRTTLLGPARHAVELARRHQRHRRELRVHDRPAQGTRRRLHPPAHGAGRGHAARRARGGCALDVGQLRRVPRRVRRQHRGERGVHGRSLRAPPLRDGGRRHAPRGDRRRAHRDDPADAPVARGRWARSLHQPFEHAPRRRRATGAEPLRVGAGAARAVRCRR